MNIRTKTSAVGPPLIVIGTFANVLDAEMARSVLEASGIECLLSSDDCSRMQPELTLTRGIRISVRREDAARAEEILLSKRSRP